MQFRPSYQLSPENPADQSQLVDGEAARRRSRNAGCSIRYVDGAGLEAQAELAHLGCPARNTKPRDRRQCRPMPRRKRPVQTSSLRQIISPPRAVSRYAARMDPPPPPLVPSETLETVGNAVKQCASTLHAANRLINAFAAANSLDKRGRRFNGRPFLLQREKRLSSELRVNGN